jgi:hypothetical protein
MSGEWLEDLPPETDGLEEVAPEDEFDLREFDMALREGRGDLVLDQVEPVDLDQQGYKRALDQERRGTKPPGLREATGKEHCGNCSHFDRGICALYTYSVDEDEWCRSWDAAD